ncbi:unnamed protein product [Hydatigera taeniaeformis]|uniref:RNase H domain-containing protein n=1 Tax=Hydatigena taeniaeformis TaxID=6205 RepID=A0A0R3X0H0_HYDTA|nr:unnamed protein product [Hydatigera taeniaeformis]
MDFFPSPLKDWRGGVCFELYLIMVDGCWLGTRLHFMDEANSFAGSLICMCREESARQAIRIARSNFGIVFGSHGLVTCERPSNQLVLEMLNH